MIRHITILMAVAMMVLLGGGCAEVNEAQQTAQPKEESEAIGFDVYTQRTKTRAGTIGDVTTDGLKTGTHSGDGFGVFAYYTGENSYDENIVPNFMYNQQVKYKSSASVFDYSPIKYWPNEEDNDHISFFAYAPWVPVDATTGAATGDKTYGITGVSRNTFTGAPIVNYIATTDLSKGVDLCWGNQLNKQKPTDASKVNFNLSHSLAKLNVQVKSSIALDGNTKIYIRSISFSGFTMKGALNLNNTTGTTPLWLGYDGLGRLNKEAVTIYDGRRDGREGSLADANEGLTGLNPNLVQSTLWDDASPKPGVTNSAYNLFDNSSAITTPAYVIPTGDPVDVTIEYDIETKDDNLKGYYLSDGKTYGTSLANRITKTNVLTSLEAGKSYTLNLNLGIQNITFTAESVKDWIQNPLEIIPLTFEAKTAGATVTFNSSGVKNSSNSAGTVKYSTDGGNSWSDYSANTITLASVGDKVSFWSEDAIKYSDSAESNTSLFSVSGDCYVYGNILSLIDYSNAINTGACFPSLFRNCSTIYNHPTKDIVLPATELYWSCYYGMFAGCTNLTRAPELPATSLKGSCYEAMFDGCTNLLSAPDLPATVVEQNCYQCMFRNCSSLTNAPALPATNLQNKYQCYQEMFLGCTSLTTAPDLPATTLTQFCYSKMFKGCTNLTTAPSSLPATAAAHSCYQEMFMNCTSLTTAPELPASDFSASAHYCYQSMFEGCTSLTTATSSLPAQVLTSNCYARMFYGCTSLTTAPSLPATTLYEECYNMMFYGCTSLTSAPALPAPTLKRKCYFSMFYGCTSLTSAPALSATTLADLCYQRMFYGCTSLTSAPSLPAETLYLGSYFSMFENCTSLTYVPDIPATTLAQQCCEAMFKGCTSLATAPSLAATTLANYCYREMFMNCTSLEYSPTLSASTLAYACYEYMFDGCTNLNSVTCLATNISANSSRLNWLRGVAANGTFYINSSLDTSNPTPWTRGSSGIPNNWTIQKYTP